ncbi:MAG TPA: thioredoxin family protein [Actinocrinis sp.]|jgi:thiol-disulfide isomerase/thioredoxin|uniref:thioredoxin family protein n=1 Tax=Actinocrinis sp. TaxID=1920516 RepID=UPI002DDCA8BB|nr:thioredoxin family protein [Actinocrinis sp.]HEV3169482.1 thioredoxin family protein [Actinocrinis sp.]
MTGLIVVFAVLAVATFFGLWRKRVDGRVRTVANSRRSESAPAGGVPASTFLTPRHLGEELGTRATLVQFSSAFCQPCRAARVILASVADETDGVAHVEIDAESHLELVRELGIMRTPTTLILDGSGRIAARASGVPRKHQVLAAINSAADGVDAPVA